MIRAKDLNWVAIDPEPATGTLPQVQYRRWIRVAVLEMPLSNIIRAGTREFWCFIDRKTSTFFIEEVAQSGLKLVEPQDLFDELWGYADEIGLLNVIIPWEEEPSLIYSDRASAMKLAHNKYLGDRAAKWQRNSDQK